MHVRAFTFREKPRSSGALRERVNLLTQYSHIFPAGKLARLKIGDGCIDRHERRLGIVRDAVLVLGIRYIELEKRKVRGPRRRLFPIDHRGIKREISHDSGRLAVRRILR